MGILHGCAELLQQKNRDLLAAMAPGHLLAANQPTIHAALFEALATALGLRDEGLAETLIKGQRAVGDIPTSGNWVQDEQPAEVELSASGNAEWNEWLREDIESRPE
eukprot:5593230-Pleurochrysis_carterae.AAC.1